MSNLPLAGSQYWGAALNNHLRQLDSEIRSLETQLENFTVAASYSGSGFTTGTYDFTKTEPNAETDKRGVFVINDKTEFNFSGSFIFNRVNAGRPLSITVTKKDSIIISFDYEADVAKKYKIGVLNYDLSSDNYIFSDRSVNLENTFIENGYYPVYILPGVGGSSHQSFRIGININQNFIFNDGYILMGLFKRMETAEGVKFYFIKKADNAFKTLYDTQRGNLQALASFAEFTTATGEKSARGLFGIDNHGKLQIYFKSAIIDYSVNGIGQEASDGSAEDNTNFKLQTDYKRFDGTNRICYKIVNRGSTEQDNPETISKLEPLKDIELDGTSSNGFNSNFIYGVYITAFGDLIIEESGDKIATLGEVVDHCWDLNLDTNFQAGTPVLLGSFFYQNGNWRYAQATTNGLSPSYLTNSSVENTDFVRWPDVTYLTYLTDKPGVSKVIPYKFLLQANGSSEGMNYLRINNSYTPSDTNTYDLLSLPTSFWNTAIEDGNINSLTIGKLKLDTPVEGKPVEINGKGELYVYGGLVSNVTEPSNSLNGKYKNIFNTMEVTGDIEFTGSGNCVINRDITEVKSLKGANNTLNLKATTINIKDTTTIDSDKNLTISAPNIILKAESGNISLDSKTDINMNQSVLFTTSDKRMKENFIDIDSKLCLEAVRKLKVKEYNYKGKSSKTLGLIAQEIETILPEYKKLIVSSHKTDNFEDERSVAESKLIFILWEAVKALDEEIHRR